MSQTKDTKEKRGCGPLLAVLVIAGALAYLFLGGKLGGNVCRDYASAGARVKPQLLKQDATLYVSLITPDYNPILGPAPVYQKILAEAMTHTGKPEEGDALALRARVDKVPVCNAAKQSGGSHKLILQLGMEYFSTPEQEKALAAESKRILDSLNLDGASDYEKVRRIYNYICQNVTYDYPHLEDKEYRLQYTAYAAAVNHTAVCSGVASLFYDLANSAGVECRIRTSTEHAWNFVKLDGLCYYLDPTWDLGRSEEEYQYFLKGDSDFNHYGGISAGVFGCGNLLTNTHEGYTFSHFAYGSDAAA